MVKFSILILSLFFTSLQAEVKFKFAAENLEKYSSTQFTWWGFNIYKAEIWTPESKKPDLKGALILHINYQKNIKSEKLVSTTRDEWERLKLLKADSEKWLKKLGQIWPDIKSGDSLTTYSDGEKTSFYQRGKLLGEIKDKTFGPVFLQIWLHKDSQTSELLKASK